MAKTVFTDEASSHLSRHVNWHSVLESGEKICMQELKVEGVSNSMPFMYYPNKNFLVFIFCQSRCYWCGVPWHIRGISHAVLEEDNPSDTLFQQ